MQIKRNNTLFLLLALIMFPLGSILGTVLKGWNLSSVIPYLLLVGIALLMLRKDEATFFDVLPVNVGLKPLTALLIVVLVFALTPLAKFLSDVCSLLGGKIPENATQNMVSPNAGVLEQLFSIAVVPAIFEELFFRGFFYAGFKRARGACAAIILSSILFGFFHAVLQQIVYAAVLGMVLAILREVTGSMWAGALYHVVNNGYSVILLGIVGQETYAKFPLERMKFLMTNGNTTGNLILSYGLLVVGLAVGALILYLIIKREGRLEDAKHFFKRPDDPKGKLITAALIIGFIFYLGATVVTSLVLNNYDSFTAFTKQFSEQFNNAAIGG